MHPAGPSIKDIIAQKLDAHFELTKNRTSVRTEVLAGLSTFLLCAYILAVNPSILGDCGMPKGGVFIATALIGAVGTFLMGLLAKLPVAIAPGMGLNAFFAYTVCLGMGFSWQYALCAVFVEGLIFLALSVASVREQIFNCIPMSLKRAFSAGIGLFIAFIGLKGAGIIRDNPASLLSMINFHNTDLHTEGACAVIAFIGILLTGIMFTRKIKGAILYGIFLTWGVGILAQALGLYIPNPARGFYSLYPDLSFEDYSAAFASFGSIFGEVFNADAYTHTENGVVVEQGLSLLLSSTFFVVMFTFFFFDLFDTIGTLTGVAVAGKMLDKNGRLPNIRGALCADSLATSIGAVFGTSTATSFVESVGGISMGARTGLTAYVFSALMLVSILLAPVFIALPSFATAPSLVIVGFMMMASIKDIAWEDPTDGIPAFLTILAMPLCNSIAEGIAWGIISYTLLNCLSGSKNAAKVSVVMKVLTVIFLLRYIFI